jgi:CRISPR-associated protein Cmr5
MPSIIANKSQERAKFAYLAISNSITGADNATKLNEDQLKELKSHIKDIPMMIKTNGLAAAFAFVFSKAKRDKGNNAKKDYIVIEDITEKWLTDEQGIYLKKVGQSFHLALIERPPEQYRRCTREIMTLYTWLKRYADGMIKDN